MERLNASPAACRILHLLLDKYESSKAHASGEATTRRVQVAMNDKVVSGYVSGGMDPDERRALHEALKALQDAGVVELEWVKFEEGNLLKRVLLQWDGIDEAYALLGRLPKRDVVTGILAELSQYRSRLVHSWMQAWLDDVERYLVSHGAIPSTLIPVEDDKRKWLLEALWGLVDKGDEELTMRLFSKRYLKSSKLFERHVKSRLVSILRRYWTANAGCDDEEAVPILRSAAAVSEAELSDEDLLAEFGIEITHEEISFCGPLRFVYEGDAEHCELDCGLFIDGLSLDVNTVRKMKITSLPIHRILSIENKANYRHYVRYERQPGELVVYLGGFHSPGKRQFLKKLRDFLCGKPVTFHHWGDLDYGGILIFQSLRESVLPKLKPWRMEPEWLDTYRDFVEPFGDAYRSKLEALLSNARYAEWEPLISKLLEVGGTLEQEAFLV